MPNLKAITEQELANFILNRINRNNKLSLNFEWKTELAEQHYKAEFVSINFDNLKKILAEKQIESSHWDTLWSDVDLSSLNFLNCQNIPLQSNCNVSDCVFTNSTINRQIVSNSNFNNCRFNNVEFNHTIVKFCNFNDVSISESKLNSTDFYYLTCKNESFHFKQCEMTSFRMEGVNGLIKEELFSNTIDGNSICHHTAWDHSHDNLLREKLKLNNKALIVILCDSITNIIDVVNFNNVVNLINFYQKYDINIVPISPAKGLKHPVFESSNLISGIILPGGPDVPDDDNDIRKKFEIDLFNLATKNKTPLLAICRGHQFVSTRFGGIIQNVENHQPNKIYIKQKPDSTIYQYLAKKFEKYEKKNINNTFLSKNEKNAFIYDSHCAHHQGVFFKKDRPNKDKVIIVAKSGDGLIEGLEINGGEITTYQHHHESIFAKDPANSVAKSSMKRFVNKVKEYSQKNQQIGIVNISVKMSQVS